MESKLIDWHPADIIAGLRKKETSMAAESPKSGLKVFLIILLWNETPWLGNGTQVFGAPSALDISSLAGKMPSATYLARMY